MPKKKQEIPCESIPIKSIPCESIPVKSIPTQNKEDFIRRHREARESMRHSRKKDVLF